MSEELLPENHLRFHPVEIIQGGLEGVLESHRQMQDNQVSGWKFVAKIADTPVIAK
jgi:hypothetical protein